MKLLLPKLSSLIPVFVYLCICAFPLSTVHADEISLIVSPPSVTLSGKPGEVLQKSIKVTNNSADQELILKALVKDFIVSDNEGTPVLVDTATSGKYLASPWFTLEKTEFTIPPKSSTQIVVLINVPISALPGGHYAGVFFQPVPARGLKNTVSYATAQVGSLFDITVAGNINYNALITDFSVKSNIAEFGPIDFSATIENQSDTHIRPTTTLTVRDMIGRKMADIKLDEVNIFPFTSRTLNGTWDTVWGLGRYTATLTAAYGPGLVATRDLTFWIMPYRLIAAVLVILLVVIVLFILIRRHLKHLEDHRDEEIDELKRKIAEMENRNS